LISFDDNGGLIISKLLKDNIHAYGLKDKEIYLSSIKEENRFYLHKHRKVFKEYESKRFSQFTS
jgi:hypothetical protein